MRLIKLGDVVLARLVEGRRGENQDRGVDQQREHQRDRGIERCQFDRLAPVLDAFAEAARLHHAGMQIEVVRHHRRADDAEREIKHVRIGDDLEWSAQSHGSLRPSRGLPSQSARQSRPQSRRAA